MSTDAPLCPMVRIEPAKTWVPLTLKDLWEFRELIYLLAWRDIRASYNQTILGSSWAILKPVFTMAIVSLIFGGLIGVPSEGMPYPIFVFTALLPWQLFARTLAGSSTSLVANENLLTKVYFPRLVVPLSAIATGILDFMIAFVVLLGMMAYYRIPPTGALSLLPLFVLLAIAAALGVGLWFAALNVRYRDVGHGLPFLTQMWMFATPIIYPASLVPESLRMVYWLNPTVGMVEGFRWALLGTGNRPGVAFMLSMMTTLAVLVSGLYYFSRMEQTFADSM